MISGEFFDPATWYPSQKTDPRYLEGENLPRKMSVERRVNLISIYPLEYDKNVSRPTPYAWLHRIITRTNKQTYSARFLVRGKYTGKYVSTNGSCSHNKKKKENERRARTRNSIWRNENPLRVLRDHFGWRNTLECVDTTEIDDRCASEMNFH